MDVGILSYLFRYEEHPVAEVVGIVAVDTAVLGVYVVADSVVCTAG